MNVILGFVAAGTLVGVGALIIAVVRSAARARDEMMAISNATIRALTHDLNLDVSEPPGDSGGRQHAFVEAYGTVSSFRILVSIESPAMDELWTTLFFPRAVLDECQTTSGSDPLTTLKVTPSFVQ